METMDEIKKHYGFTSQDEKRLGELAEMLLPIADALAEDFYQYLSEDSYTAGFFHTEAAIQRRKQTLREWFNDLLTAEYNNAFLRRLERIGKVHVKIGLRGHYVNASMNFIRRYCMSHLQGEIREPARAQELIETLNKILDIHLDVITSSYREEELKQVFVSKRVESALIRWSERLIHGLNLILMIGLLVMAVGIASLLGTDIYYAFSENLENGVIKALGSLLILWMLIELLHTQVRNLRGGKFRARVFVELALVAFIRKLFVASIEEKEPVVFGGYLAGLLILGVIYFLLSKAESTRMET